LLQFHYDKSNPPKGAKKYFRRREAVKEGVMNKFKKIAIGKEFPFLTQIAGELEKELDDFTDIKIARVDRPFLFSVPKDDSWDGSCGESYEYHRLFGVWPLNEGGYQVREIDLTPSRNIGSNYAYSQRISEEGDTYLSSLLGGLDDAAFYVLYHRDYSDWQGNQSVDMRTLTVLKPPKGFTILDCIEEALRDAEREVTMDCDLVDCHPVIK